MNTTFHSVFTALGIGCAIEIIQYKVMSKAFIFEDSYPNM